MLGQMLRAEWRVAGRAVQAGADGRGSHVDLEQFLAGVIEVADAVADHHRVGAEFLSEGHGHGILVFRAAHLDDVRELLGFRLEGR
jgi:hypothetical protein